MTNVEILKVEFYDYTMTKLTPTNVTIETFNQYEIKEEVTNVQWGSDKSRHLSANAKITDNVMNVVNISASDNPLRSKRQVTFIKLNTIDKEYTKFIFIQ